MTGTAPVPSEADIAVVLVGHGSARHPDSANPILALAETLRVRGPWREVTAVFMKQEPRLDRALHMVAAPRVAIVPVFAGKGYYTDKLIPREMGLTGLITRRDGRILHYTAPVGCHPRIPYLLTRRAEDVARSAGFDPTSVGLLLIAHGSSRPGGSGETPKAIAAAIAAMNRFAEVALAFLEQQPFARDWQKLVRPGGGLVVLPLLVAQGTHASQDIPPLFNLTAGQSGPVDIGGRQVLMTAGLGAELELADIIAGMVADAMADEKRP